MKSPLLTTLALALALPVSANLEAQTPSGPATTPVKLVYSVSRTPELPFETARSVTVITHEDIERWNPASLPDLLVPYGVFIEQQTPTLQHLTMRGLNGRRVLVMIDGVQLNSAAVETSITAIDVAIIERVEIVRGIGSALGSEALGGIVNVITRRGDGPAVGIRASSRYASANDSRTGRVEVIGQTPTFRYVAGLTRQENGDMHIGGGVLQAPTKYGFRSFNLGLDVFPSPDKTLSMTFRDGTIDHSAHYDGIANGNLITFDDQTEQRLAVVRFSDLTDRRFWSTLQATGYWLGARDASFRIFTRAKNVFRTIRGSDAQSGLNLELGTFIGRQHLLYGVDLSTDLTNSSDSLADMVTGKVTSVRGFYMDGAHYSTAAAYAQDQIAIGTRLHTTLGVRYSAFQSAGQENSIAGDLDIAKVNTGLTGVIHNAYRVTPTTSLIANVSRGFRAPNVADFSTYSRTAGNSFDVPAPTLKPEALIAYEAGAKIERPRVSGSAFYFYNVFTDVISRHASTFKGLNFVDENGNGTRDVSEAFVYQNQNVGRMTIQGLELEAEVRLPRGLVVSGSQTTTLAQDQVSNTPASRIPPRFGTLGVRWSPSVRRIRWTEVVYEFGAPQHRLSPIDIADSTRVGPNGTPGFDVVNLRTGVDVTSFLPLSIAIENLTDRRYKYHAGTVMRPGRQLVIGIAARF